MILKYFTWISCFCEKRLLKMTLQCFSLLILCFAQLYWHSKTMIKFTKKKNTRAHRREFLLEKSDDADTSYTVRSLHSEQIKKVKRKICITILWYFGNAPEYLSSREHLFSTCRISLFYRIFLCYRTSVKYKISLYYRIPLRSQLMKTISVLCISYVHFVDWQKV